ncbi:ATP-binding protein [Streptomyces sp. NPDC002537]
MNQYGSENEGGTASADDTWPRDARFVDELQKIESRIHRLMSEEHGSAPFANRFAAELDDTEGVEQGETAAADRRADELREGRALTGRIAGSHSSDSGTDRLAVLAAEYGLSRLEADILIAALLPDIDPIYSPVFQMLGGTSPGMRPTVATLLAVNEVTVLQAVSCGLLAHGSALVGKKLLHVEDGRIPFPQCQVQVAPRVISFLAGGQGPQDVSTGCLQPLPSRPGAQRESSQELVIQVSEALQNGASAGVYLRQGAGGEALPLARAAFEASGHSVVALDLEALLAQESLHEELLQEITMELRLFSAGLMVSIPGTIDDAERAKLQLLVRHFAREPIPVVYYGVDSRPPATDVPMELSLDVRGEVSRRDRLCPAAVSSVERARRDAAIEGRELDRAAVRELVHRSAVRDLEALSRRVTPAVAQRDLKLPEETQERLRVLVSRVRHREMVMGEWQLRKGGGRGWGVTALFAGDSGTGKTMAAEVVAAELGVDLYIISLSTVVSKYIGETERNLERIFSAADCLDAAVLFDEADSLFAKRGEVKGANDRHANMQSAYLLQRLEEFGGLAILTTNLRFNIDTAFTRRFDEVIDFPKPDTETRLELWKRFLYGEAVPVAQDLDLELNDIAERFDLAGGSIRSSVEAAAFVALREDRPIGGEHLLAGIKLEYGKLGRLLDETLRSV